MTNNHQDMKTVVETFFVEETTNLIHDADSLQKWGDLIEFLDLGGQKTIVKEEKSPIPFLWMNRTLIEVFEVLCPSKSDIKNYNKMPIPLEILELVALSKREDYFDFIEIWYDEKTPDPVCIGYKIPEDKKSQNEWNQKWYAEKYLIGKWSDVKASFKELTERAKQRFINEKSDTLTKEIKMKQRELEDIEITANQKFGFSNSINHDLPF